MAKRFPTKYPGVYYIEGVSSDGKSERIYYIKYRRGGKVIEEPVGRQFRDDMTPARASINAAKTFNFPSIDPDISVRWKTFQLFLCCMII